MRIPSTTLRVLAVIAVAAFGGPAAAEGERSSIEVGKDLRAVARTDLSLADRVAAAQRVVDGPALGRDQAEAALRAAPALAREAPEVALRLLVRAVDARPFPLSVRAEAQRRFQAPAGAWSAAATLALRTSFPGELELYGFVPAWPRDGVVAEVLRREVSPPVDAPDRDPAALDKEALHAALVAENPARIALMTAEETDPERARWGLDHLVVDAEHSLPLLLHEARMAAAGVPPGRVPRATRAIVALGMIGDKRATAVLAKCLGEAPSGWVRVAAATALGDLGDPAGVVALCRQLLYRGDVYRPREQWEYPGEQETSIPQAQWADVEYYAIDTAAADALLRLGVRNAAGWLIRNKLDPAKGRFRIRVLQDTQDALRRSTNAPWASFVPDSGIPQRRDAYHALRAWWEGHRFDPSLTKVTFPADDAGYREVMKPLLENLHSKIMEIQISHETCQLLGPAATPLLVDLLPTTTKKHHRVELARAFGDVEDVAAVEPLKGLLKDDAASVRSTAAEALALYATRAPGLEAALVPLLDDKESGPRVSALKTISALPPSASLLAAVKAHPAAKHEALVGGEDREYRIAERVALLALEGETHWPAVKEGLAHAERYLRRQWWDLVRRALRLPDEVFDPNPDPGTPSYRAADETGILQALRARGSR